MLRPSPLPKSSVSTTASLCWPCCKITAPRNRKHCPTPPVIQKTARGRHSQTQMEKQIIRLPVSQSGQCCTHTEGGIAFLTWNVSSSTITRRFTQALIPDHSFLCNNVSGQETSWVKMADARFSYGPVGRQLLQGGSAGVPDLEIDT